MRKEAFEAAFARHLGQITLKTNDTMRLLRAIVTETWHNLQNDTILEQAMIISQLSDLDKKKEVLLDKLLVGTVSDDLYQRKLLEIEGEVTILKAKRRAAEIEETRTEAVLDHATHLFASARRIWERTENINDRQRFQRVLYPDGISYTQENG